MIVEFIGSTGAGKTTLVSEVQHRLAQTTEVATAFDVVAAPLGLDHVTYPTVRNLIQETLGSIYLLPSLPLYKTAISFSLRMLARKADASILTINNLRSIIRKFGVYEMIRRHPHKQIVLVDEGTVLLAHILFVYSSAQHTAGEIAEFANLIPMPDMIVYVRAPLDSLIKRSLQRTDPPREMKTKDPALIEKYINDAVAMFEQLIKTDEIRNRVLIVENPECDDIQSIETVDFISRSILNHHAIPLQNQSNTPVKVPKVC